MKEQKNAKGATPLLYAVTKKLGDSTDRYSDESKRHFLMIREFLLSSANPDKPDEKGWTPLLMYALQGNDADTFVELLHYSETACDTINDDGITVLAALKKNRGLSSQTVVGGTFETSVLGHFQKECFGK
jgi:ankyrin repeat protein